MWKKVIPVAAVLILAWIGLNLMTAKDAEESVAHAPDAATSEVAESAGDEAEAVHLAESATADVTPETAPMDEEPAEVAPADEEPTAETVADTATSDDATETDTAAETSTEAAASTDEETIAETTEIVAAETAADASGSTVAMRYPTDPVTGATIYDQGMVEVVIEPTAEPAEEVTETASEQSTDTTEPASEEVAATEPEEVVEPVTVNKVAMRYPIDPVTGASIFDQGMVEVEFESVVEPGEEVAEAASDQKPEATAASESTETAEGNSNVQMRYPTDPVTGATIYDQGMVEVASESDAEVAVEEVAESAADQAQESTDTAESVGDKSNVQMRYPTDPVTGATIYDQGMVEVEAEIAENEESSSEEVSETAAAEVPVEATSETATEDSAETETIAEVAVVEADAETATMTGEAATIAERGTFSLGAISRTLGSVFGTTTTVLSTARDEASAQAVLPRLEAASSSLGAVADQYATLPDYAKGPLAKVIKRGMARLKPLADTALTREGVGPVLLPVMGPMLDSMQAMLR